MLLSSNVALIGGNPTKPGSSYYALIKAALSLVKFQACRDAADNKLNTRASDLPSWSGSSMRVALLVFIDITVMAHASEDI